MCQVDITLPDINRACQVEINFSEILLLTLMLSYVGVKLIDQMDLGMKKGSLSYILTTRKTKICMCGPV